MLIQVGIAIGGEAVLLFLGGVIIAGVMLIRMDYGTCHWNGMIFTFEGFLKGNCRGIEGFL